MFFTKKSQSASCRRLYQMSMDFLPLILIFLLAIYNGRKHLTSDRTKNVPWHILAPAAVACDIIIERRSAHPAGGFFI
ncbi:hypothetical protein DORFOR_00085 [Dorea formicigenerans ATCC 27755]|uniref:Uncharacterized protein n=2 Tax=Dorea formicigenerans TaxID=39486 RepID=B0G1G5_9FIRM|nr:hypothetical protein DORFOR_00085 [Dorea formicigenerans ATCC 27755]